MRVISGKYRGRIIYIPKGVKIRPTADKVREALFDILKNRISGASFLDLYCGSGACGIEAISNGSEDIYFVDSDPRCIATVKRNLEDLILPITNVFKMDAIESIRFFIKKGLQFDIIFLDPPYYRDLIRNTLLALGSYDILTQSGLIIAESFKKDLLPEETKIFKLFRQKFYGDTVLSFYEKK